MGTLGDVRTLRGSARRLLPRSCGSRRSAVAAERMYDEDLEPRSNVIEVHVAQVRRKLDPHDELKPIETILGRGYLFTAPRKS